MSIASNTFNPLPSTSVDSAKFFRLFFMALVIVDICLCLVGIPVSYIQRQTACDWSDPFDCVGGQLDSATLDAIQSEYINPVAYAAVVTVFAVIWQGILWVCVVLMTRRVGENRSAWLGCILFATCMLNGEGLTGVSMIIPALAVFRVFSGITNAIVMTAFFVTFPNGRFIPRWTLPLVVLLSMMVVTQFLLMFLPNVPATLYTLTSLVNALPLIPLVILYRYWRIFTPLERYQTRWVLLAIGIDTIGRLILAVLPQLVPAVAEQASFFLAVQVIQMVITIIFFSCVGIALLFYHLFDVDVIIQRTLVYSVLTVAVAGLYILVVGFLSSIFQISGNFLISLLATGVVAVTFHPLREGLQNLVQRYIFGDRDNPYAVISRLSERLENHGVPGELLPSIVETVAQALKLPYVAIALIDGDSLKTDAVYGQPSDQGRITVLPLLYQQEKVGQMLIGQARGDRILDSAEQQLLENVARQTGIAAHALQLNIALQQSRQQIITAREEERLRLRRDLHDGLGPALASHTVKIGTARMVIDSDPQTARRILDELESSLANSLTDIRRLVYNLRPPALDQLGMLPALHDFLQQCSGRTQFTLYAPEVTPPLPAAVEVASYRIVQESVNNVIRHAMARQCHVEICINGALIISIRDDGIGLPSKVIYGVGLKSMSERAEELGGTFAISAMPHKGTCIDVRIPL